MQKQLHDKSFRWDGPNFRLDKLPPPDIVSLTGLQSAEVFHADHPTQYQRLLDPRELDKLLANVTAQSMHEDLRPWAGVDCSRFDTVGDGQQRVFGQPASRRVR